MTGDSQFKLYGAIEKFDAASDGSLMVSGIASTESVDNSGEVVTADAMRKALPSYLQSGSVREMHQPIAAGCPISAHVDDDGRTHFTAKIVDVGTIAKIKSNVLKGFSIGAKPLRKVGNTIHEILLKEISVVDLPCNTDARFTLIKFDKPSEDKKHKEDCDCKDCNDSKKKKSMDAEHMKKFDELAATVATLAKSIETLSAKPSPDIAKLESTIGDLQKRADEAQAAAINAERSSIISKMAHDGRVAFKDDNTAFTSDELQKMDLPLLKFAARNSQSIPTLANATYSDTGGGPTEADFTKVDRATGKTVPLQGSELIQKAYEGFNLSKMIRAGTTANL